MLSKHCCASMLAPSVPSVWSPGTTCRPPPGRRAAPRCHRYTLLCPPRHLGNVLCSTHCTIYTVKYTLYRALYTVHSVHRTLSSLNSSVCIAALTWIRPVVTATRTLHGVLRMKSGIIQYLQFTWVVKSAPSM